MLVRTLTTAYEALAELNPFRYRGYVYDEETGLYYLRSRYYDSTCCRFINVDSYSGKLGQSYAHNLSAYACNSPIGFIDEDGHSAIAIVVTAVAAVSSGVNIGAVGSGVAK